MLTRPSQLELLGKKVCQGIYAPTIRYHEGVYYMITTNVPSPGYFYVTAKDPAGPWSDPVYLPDAEGFDPSLFFDEDGICYYVGNRAKKPSAHYGDYEIWLRRLDLEERCLKGETYVLWDGCSKYTYWPEGPHIYRHGKWYYLLIAECGTAFEHCITVARAKAVTGPYESCPNNPLLTHRHLGRDYPVQRVGHADLVEGLGGQWYAVLLATRPREGSALLGRETFIARVDWQRGWLVFNRGEGKLREAEFIGPEKEGVPSGERLSLTGAAGAGEDELPLNGGQDTKEGICAS